MLGRFLHAQGVGRNALSEMTGDMAEATLEVLDRLATAGLPEGHAGIASGPVSFAHLRRSDGETRSLDGMLVVDG